MQDRSSNTQRNALSNLPLVEDAGLDDRTVASPALGYGMEREHAMPEPMGATPEPAGGQPQPIPSATPQPAGAQAPLPVTDKPLLSRDEVAAISVDDRSYYVSDVASPYLSQKQANEDVSRTRRRHARTAGIVTVIVILCVLGVGGWFLWQAMYRAPTAALPKYNTANIEHGEFLETVDATIMLNPSDERDVLAGISGTVEELFVEEGSTVSAGDTICRINNPTITDSYNKARQAVDTASANLEAKERALADANKALQDAQGTGTATQTQGQTGTATGTTTTTTANPTAVANAQARVQAAQNDVTRATDSLKSIQTTLQRAQEQQDLLTVTAPIAGTVNGLNAQAGVSATVTGSTHICNVTDTSSFGFQVEIPTDLRDHVAEGQEVRVTYPSVEGLQSIARIASFEDGEGRHLANVVITEPDSRLTKGMAASASVIVQSVPDSLIVPIAAIQRDKSNAPFLEVLLDPTRDIKRNIPVEVVATNKTHAAVKASNIQEGNTVIVPQAETTAQSTK